MNTCDTPGCQIDHTGDSRTKGERLMDAIFDTPESVREARRLGQEYAFSEGTDPAYATTDMSEEANAFWEAAAKWLVGREWETIEESSRERWRRNASELVAVIDRASSDDCKHPDSWFSRAICECGSMHDHCTECGTQVQPCRPVSDVHSTNDPTPAERIALIRVFEAHAGQWQSDGDYCERTWFECKCSETFEGMGDHERHLVTEILAAGFHRTSAAGIVPRSDDEQEKP